MESGGQKANSLTIPESVVCEYLDGETVLLNLQTGHYFGLNAVGTLVWRDLVAHGDPGRATEHVCDAFADQPPERVRADVSALIERLESRGLVVRSHSPGEDPLV